MDEDAVLKRVLPKRNLQHALGDIEADIAANAITEQCGRLAAAAAKLDDRTKIWLRQSAERGTIEISEIFQRMRILEVCRIGGGNLVIVKLLCRSFG